MLPHSGAVKIATNEVTEASTPAQTSTASRETTPSSGRNSGMIGLRMLNEMLITNWTPTIVHSVRCQCCASLRRRHVHSIDASISLAEHSGVRQRCKARVGGTLCPTARRALWVRRMCEVSDGR